MAKTVGELRTQLAEWQPSPLPASGQISASDINVELGRPYNAEFNIGGVEERDLAQVPTGQISFSDFHGKSSNSHNLTVGVNGPQNIYGFNPVTGFGAIAPGTTNTPYGTRTLTLLQADVSNNYFDIDTSTPAMLDGLDLLTMSIGYNGVNTPAMTYDSLLLIQWSAPDGLLFAYLQGENTNTVPINVQWSAPIVIDDIDDSNTMTPGNNGTEAGFSVSVFGSISNLSITWGGVVLDLFNISINQTTNVTTLQMGNPGAAALPAGTIVFKFDGSNESFIFKVDATSDATFSANGYGAQELYDFMVQRNGLFTNMYVFSVE